MLICFYVAVTRRVMLLEPKQRQKHFLIKQSAMSAAETELTSLWQADPPHFCSTDGHLLLFSPTDGRGIRAGIIGNERSQIIISDVSTQPLVQTSTRTSKSIHANLDPSSHGLSSSRLFPLKPLGSLHAEIISTGLLCAERDRSRKTLSCNDI